MNIYVTFDYELFLSEKTGSVENCLIKPTEEIIRICNKYNIKTTFFIDTTFLCKAREYSALEKESQKIFNQISKLAKEGHSIQLHIHPQWFYSTYDEINGWNMDFNHYKLSDCSITDIHFMFDEGIALIKEITGKKCNAYRAGGYSIQTLSNYAEFLREKGIVIDSSCLCNKASKSKYQEYNFKNIKFSNIYKFNNRIEQPNNNGDIIELPISTSKINQLKYILQKRKKCKNITILYGDGKGIGSKVSFIQKLINKMKLLLFPFYISASIDRQTGVMLENIYKNLKRKKCKDMTIIIHPKNTTNYSLIFLEEFLLMATREYCHFKTTYDIN